MKFDTPAGRNPIDQGRVIGIPHDRIDGAAWRVFGAASADARAHAPTLQSGRSAHGA